MDELYGEGTSAYGMREGFRLRVVVDKYADDPLTGEPLDSEHLWAHLRWRDGRVYTVFAERETVYVNRDDDRDTLVRWEVVGSAGGRYLTTADDASDIPEYSALDVARAYDFEGVAPVFTAKDIGCYLEGVHGWHNNYAVVDMAVRQGMKLSRTEREDLEAYRKDQGMHSDDPDGVPGAVVDQGGLVDRATHYLDSISDEGLSWEWDMGELSLVHVQDDEV